MRFVKVVTRNYSAMVNKFTVPDDRKALEYVDSHDSCESKIWNGKDCKDKFFINEIFNNENLGSVRVLVDENREPWFLGVDVAECLGYKPKHRAETVAKFTDEDDRKPLKYGAPLESGDANLWGINDHADKIFINEAGLYSMIFGSQMEKAKEFKNWITHTVLPSVREHGGYILGQEKLAEEKRNALNNKIVALMKKVSYLLNRRQELIQDSIYLREKKRNL